MSIDSSKYPAKKVLMISPRNFISNPETSVDNSFQAATDANSNPETEALEEFTRLKNLLLSNGIEVKAYAQKDELFTPDAIFPNNWFSTHPEGKLFLYPMKALNRRSERRKNIIDELKINYPYLTDFSGYEKESHFLEGTGSMVIDTENRIVYAAKSQRTSVQLLKEWSAKMNYESVVFEAEEQNHSIVYHTNVVMTLGDKFAIVCMESIREDSEKNLLRNKLEATGKEIIEISLEQMHAFCGNCLLLQNVDGEHLLVMSSRSFQAFTSQQKNNIEKYAKIIHTDLHTIENYGGGGARCMLAELF